MSLFKSRGKHASNAKGALNKQKQKAPAGAEEELGAAESEAAKDVEPVEAALAADAESEGAEDSFGAQGDEGAEADISGDDAASDADDTEALGEADEPAEQEAPGKSESPEGADAAGEAAAGNTAEATKGVTGVSGGDDSNFANFEAATGGFVQAGFSEVPAKKRRRGLKIIGITLGIVAAAALIAYIVGGVVFVGRFLPNTKIGDQDVSLKTNEEVVSMLEDIVADYRLDVVGGGFSYRATGEELDLSIDAPGIVDAMHADLNSWKWPLLILQPSHDETDQLSVSCKPAAYSKAVTEAVEKYNESEKDPVNATIEYDKKTGKFNVKPEEAGTKLDDDAVIASVANAIAALEPKVSVGDEQLIQPTVLATDEKLIAAAELATGMVSANLTLIMDGKDVGSINGEMLSGFISVNEGYEVVFREEEMNAWVDSVVAGFSTVGSERSYTRADGKAIVVSGGVYGWDVDTEALRNAIVEGIKAGSAADIEVPCIETAEVFNGAGQRDWGNRYIDVDISEQHVRFYGADGAIIWEADCISGAPDGKHNTGEGVWYVNAKESPSKLIGYENGKKQYETTVKFWMPFEGNGIGFHDATWQPSFGGSMYANGYGSHGCVNLSYSDAETLYGIIEEGDVVVVHG